MDLLLKDDKPADLLQQASELHMQTNQACRGDLTGMHLVKTVAPMRAMGKIGALSSNQGTVNNSGRRHVGQASSIACLKASKEGCQLETARLAVPVKLHMRKSLPASYSLRFTKRRQIRALRTPLHSQNLPVCTVTSNLATL